MEELKRIRAIYVFFKLMQDSCGFGNRYLSSPRNLSPINARLHAVKIIILRL